jgi:hypothetical protein
MNKVQKRSRFTIRGAALWIVLAVAFFGPGVLAALLSERP